VKKIPITEREKSETMRSIHVKARYIRIEGNKGENALETQKKKKLMRRGYTIWKMSCMS